MSMPFNWHVYFHIIIIANIFMVHHIQQKHWTNSNELKRTLERKRERVKKWNVRHGHCDHDGRKLNNIY